MNEGPENKNWVEKLTKKYGIKRIVVSIYHPQANGIIEKKYRLIVNTFSKMTDESLGNWVQNLPAVLWVDRIIVRRFTGRNSFYLNCGRDPILPIKFDIPI